MRKQVVIILNIICMVHIGMAKDNVKSYLEQIILNQNEPESYMKSYLQPLSTALSTAMGGALYHRAYTKGFPRLDIGISVAYVNIPNGENSFLNSSGNEVATIFGSGSGSIRGFNKNAFMIPFLHANIGLFANLEATVRFTTLNIDYLGDLNIYGAGLKYDLSDMIPVPLLDLSAQAMYHKFSLGQLMDAGEFSMNLQASVSLPVLPIDIYGGVGIDNSTLEVSTDKLGTSVNIGNIRIDGENSVRFNVGLSYTMLMFNIHADYNLGEYNSVGAGLMLVF